MKIVDKIRILIVPLVLVPFVAIVIGTIFFGRVYLYNIYGQYNSDGIHPYANPIYAMNGSAEAVLRELQTEVQQDPDRFLDVAYLKQIETELREKHVDFLMLVDRSVYYCSASFPEQYLALIPDYDAAVESIEGGIYVDDKTPFYIRQEDFMLSDGRGGSFFVVIYAETVSTYMRRALIEITIFVALVQGLVSAFITIYMYRNFLRPLKALQEGTNRIKEGNLKELNIIVKADVDGSVEALSDSLIKLGNEEVQVNVIHKAVGQISENDVMLAMTADAIIIGFQVRPSVGARKMAETEHIDIRLYSIIYDAINELKDAIEGMLAPETQEKIVANLEIRETFKISKVGTIAGCMCLDGKINRQSNIRIIRDGIVVYTGKLASLKRFKDDVKEVVSGQDCGLNIENYNDIKVGDIVEAYEVIEIKRKL